MGIRLLHLNFTPEPLLICHPSKLHTICRVSLQMVPHEYYSTRMPHTFHLFALISDHDANSWDAFPPQRARGSSRPGHMPHVGFPVHQKWQNSPRPNIYLSFQGHRGIFSLGHTCDSQEKCCPCFWMELHMDSIEGNKWTWRHMGCIVSSLYLSTGT